MIVSLIVACTRNCVIGKNGAMPWYQSADLAYFKHTTLEHCIIMGRRTFDTFAEQKPLPRRTNIVLSRNADLKLTGCLLVDSLEKALDIARNANETECFIIGGEQIYRLALRYVQRIYLTYLETELQGDTFFPQLNWTEWKQVTHISYPSDSKNQYPYTFTIWERVDF